MAMRSNGRPIAGNTRDGRLYTTGREGSYDGERRLPNGKFEMKRFVGKRHECTEEWERWKAEGLAEANIHVDTMTKAERGGREMAQATKQTADMMYVLAYKAPRTQKNIALFKDMDAAMRMADALMTALEASGSEGEYDVSELKVWG